MGSIEAELRDLLLESLFTSRKFIRGNLSCFDIEQHDIMHVANDNYYVLSVISETLSDKRLQIKSISSLEKEELSELAKTGTVFYGWNVDIDSDLQVSIGQSFHLSEVCKKRGIIKVRHEKT